MLFINDTLLFQELQFSEAIPIRCYFGEGKFHNLRRPCSYFKPTTVNVWNFAFFTSCFQKCLSFHHWIPTIITKSNENNFILWMQKRLLICFYKDIPNRCKNHIQHLWNKRLFSYQYYTEVKKIPTNGQFCRGFCMKNTLSELNFNEIDENYSNIPQINFFHWKFCL